MWRFSYKGHVIFMSAFSSQIKFPLAGQGNERSSKFSVFRYCLFIWSSLHSIVEGRFSGYQHRRVLTDYDRVTEGRNEKALSLWVQSQFVPAPY